MSFSRELTYQNIAEVSEQLKNELLALKLSAKEINNTLLLLEEVFVRMHDHDALQDIRVMLRRRIGDVQVILSAEGSEFDPISELKDWSAGSEDYYRTLIIRGNREETVEKLRRLEPVLLDVLPLTLEEVFTYEMKKLGYSFDDVLGREEESHEQEAV